MSGDDAGNFDLFVGRSTQPHPRGAPVSLALGDLICAVKAGVAPPPRQTFSDLLATRGEWGPSDQFPRPLLKSGICLLHEDRRYFVHRGRYPGQPPEEVAAQTVGLQTTASFLKVAQPPGLDNVLLNGNHCKGVACILPIRPPVADGMGTAVRDDNVCFFDLRPAGGKPIHHYQLGGTRHLATVLASLGVRAPAGHVLTCDVVDVDGFITTGSGATVTVWPTPAGRDADPDDESDPMQGEDSDSEPADDDIDSADLTDDAPPAPPPPPRSRNRRYSRTPRRMYGKAQLLCLRQKDTSCCSRRGPANPRICRHVERKVLR